MTRSPLASASVRAAPVEVQVGASAAPFATEHTSASGMKNTGNWTEAEKNAFMEGLQKHGKHWKKISMLIKTRSLHQIRRHANGLGLIKDAKELLVQTPSEPLPPQQSAATALSFVA